MQTSQDPERGTAPRRTVLTAAFVAMLAMTVGIGAGLAAVSFDLLPTGDGDTAAAGPTSAPRCDDADTTPLRVAAAPEIAPALEDLTSTARSMEEALRCRTVEVTSTPGAMVRDALARGWVEASDGPPPHVWVPTTSTEIELARETSSVQGLLNGDSTSIAISPKVIAMPQPMADALGWPDAELSWNAVAKLMAADDTWAERGHDEWGPFTLSLVEGVVAEPSIDAVGAITRAVGALPSAPTDAASEDASGREFEARAQLLLLERKIAYLGDTTQAQLDALQAADADGTLLQTVSALPLTEQQVWQYNRSDVDTKLVAWCPDDGGADADYPYAILNGPWADQSTTVAAEAFLDLLTSAEGRERLQADGFRDQSRQSTPQLAEQKTIRPDRAPPAPEPLDVALITPVLRAWRGLSQVGNLLTVIDVSGSMAIEVPGTGASRLELSVAGASAGLTLFDPKTTVGLWEFSTDIGPGGEDYRELIPLGPLEDDINGVARRDAAVAALRQLQPRADTGLYDTIAAAYEHMQDNHQPGRLNALVVLTDGANDDDGLTLDELQARLRNMVDPEREIAILAVGYGPEADFEALNAITAVTDGKLYALQRPEDIRNVFVDVQTGGVGG